VTPSLAATWPAFAGELAGLLRAEGHDALAAQVGALTVVERCGCDDDFCQSFYTRPKPDGPYRANRRNVVLSPPGRGYLILDVVDEEIAYVEVLYRSPLE
jgi:hypothetical protein